MEQLNENLALADQSDTILTLEELTVINKTLGILHENDEIPNELRKAAMYFSRHEPDFTWH